MAANPEDNQTAESTPAQSQAPEADMGDQPSIALDSSWSQIWQLPVLLLGLGLLGFGVWLALPSSEPPDLEQALDDGAAYIKANNLDQAEKSLEIVREHKDLASAKQLGRMDAYFGDLNHLQIHKLDLAHVDPKVAQNTNQRIVRWYRQAEDEYGYSLDPRQLTRLAQALVNLGRDDKALALGERFDPAKPARRYGIVRQLIENHLAQMSPSDQNPGSLSPLIERFEEELAAQTDKAKKRRGRIWIAGVRARLRLDGNAPNEAIRLLNRRLIRLFRPGNQADLAPLYVLLAQAHQQLEDYDTALEHYGLAQAMIEPTNPLNSQILLGQGRIRLIRGDLNSTASRENLYQALHLFKTAVHEFPIASESQAQVDRPQVDQPGAGDQGLVRTLFGSAYLGALIGQADAEARVGQHQQAARHFTQAVEELDSRSEPMTKMRQRLVQAVSTHGARARADHAYFRALDLLQRLEPLYHGNWPENMLRRLAEAHQALARQYLARSDQPSPDTIDPPSSDATGVEGSQPGGAINGPSSPLGRSSADQNSPGPNQGQSPDAGPGRSQTIRQADQADADASWYSPTDQARRLNNQQASIHFDKAADLYRQLAKQVTITKDQAHGQALWQAARNYERSQNWKKAIDSYDRFVETRIEDPRLIEAKYRLAKAYLADHQTGPAINLFHELIERHPKAKWSNESLTPLARAYLEADQPAKARATLVKATSDHPAITPESAVYRQALIQLGKLYYRMGRSEPQFYIDAIETLSQAVSRYGQTKAGAELRYLLAESNRLSIKQLDRKLAQRDARRQQIALQSERKRRLEQAEMYYNQAVTELDDRPDDQLSTLEKTYLRNAYFYQADCAFDLRRFEQAIDLYKAAARRWEQDPASLVAHVQIFNAYCELGRYRAAKVANDRALWQLNRIPEKTFENDPTLPMSREHWEDWLRWNSELQLVNPQQASQANADG